VDLVDQKAIAALQFQEHVNELTLLNGPTIV